MPARRVTRLPGREWRRARHNPPRSDPLPSRRRCGSGAPPVPGGRPAPTPYPPAPGRLAPAHRIDPPQPAYPPGRRSPPRRCGGQPDITRSSLLPLSMESSAHTRKNKPANPSELSPIPGPAIVSPARLKVSSVWKDGVQMCRYHQRRGRPAPWQPGVDVTAAVQFQIRQPLFP